jgi:hypothetical protein
MTYSRQQMAMARSTIARAHDHLSRASCGTVFAHPDEEDPLGIEDGYFEYVDVSEAIKEAEEGLNLLKEAHSLMQGENHDPLPLHTQNAQAH